MMRKMWLLTRCSRWSMSWIWPLPKLMSRLHYRTASRWSICLVWTQLKWNSGISMILKANNSVIWRKQNIEGRAENRSLKAGSVIDRKVEIMMKWLTKFWTVKIPNQIYQKKCHIIQWRKLIRLWVNKEKKEGGWEIIRMGSRYGKIGNIHPKDSVLVPKGMIWRFQ